MAICRARRTMPTGIHSVGVRTHDMALESVRLVVTPFANSMKNASLTAGGLTLCRLGAVMGQPGL